MKHSLKFSMWALVLLSLSVILIACGPAVDPDDEAIEEETAESTAVPTLESVETETSDETNELVVEPVVGELEYIEIEAGTGPAAESGDRVSVHYTGKLDDGTVFDSSVEKGTPIEFVLGRGEVIPGWDQGIALMKEGGKATLVIPSNLAYGPQGAGDRIPPNATLTFDVELVAVVKPPQPTVIAESEFETLDSNLKIADVVSGEGEEVVSGDRIAMHFSAWIQDGEFLSSSLEQGIPVIYTLGTEEIFFNEWDDAVIGMKIGGKRQIIIPPEAGSQVIPPGETLILEFELIEKIEPILRTEVDEEDFITTESGLQYADIVIGNGDPAIPGTTVTVHYTGWLEDETQFDSSVERGEPAQFPLGVGGVIPGWEEGVTGMLVGGKRQLIIPPELGYGETGAGPVPPNATLIFDVELIEVNVGE